MWENSVVVIQFLGKLKLLKLKTNKQKEHEKLTNSQNIIDRSWRIWKKKIVDIYKDSWNIYIYI